MHSDEEAWHEAAARAVVECLGRLCDPLPVDDGFLPEGRYSRRRQTDTVYRYRVFRVDFEDGDQVVWPLPSVWRTPAEILARDEHPVSPTAIEIIGTQIVNDEVAGWAAAE